MLILASLGMHNSYPTESFRDTTSVRLDLKRQKGIEGHAE